MPWRDQLLTNREDCWEGVEIFLWVACGCVYNIITHRLGISYEPCVSTVTNQNAIDLHITRFCNPQFAQQYPDKAIR